MKVDYMIIGNETASVTLYINTGYMTHVEPAVAGGYAAAVRLADVNGDGFDDYISVGPNGEALAYLNNYESGDHWTWTRVSRLM